MYPTSLFYSLEWVYWLVNQFWKDLITFRRFINILHFNHNFESLQSNNHKVPSFITRQFPSMYQLHRCLGVDTFSTETRKRLVWTGLNKIYHLCSVCFLFFRYENSVVIRHLLHLNVDDVVRIFSFNEYVLIIIIGNGICVVF